MVWKNRRDLLFSLDDHNDNNGYDSNNSEHHKNRIQDQRDCQSSYQDQGGNRQHVIGGGQLELHASQRGGCNPSGGHGQNDGNARCVSDTSRTPRDTRCHHNVPDRTTGASQTINNDVVELYCVSHSVTMPPLQRNQHHITTTMAPAASI